MTRNHGARWSQVLLPLTPMRDVVSVGVVVTSVLLPLTPMKDVVSDVVTVTVPSVLLPLTPMSRGATGDPLHAARAMEANATTT